MKIAKTLSGNGVPTNRHIAANHITSAFQKIVNNSNGFADNTISSLNTTNGKLVDYYDSTKTAISTVASTVSLYNTATGSIKTLLDNISTYEGSLDTYAGRFGASITTTIIPNFDTTGKTTAFKDLIDKMISCIYTATDAATIMSAATLRDIILTGIIDLTNIDSGGNIIHDTPSGGPITNTHKNQLATEINSRFSTFYTSHVSYIYTNIGTYVVPGDSLPLTLNIAAAVYNAFDNEYQNSDLNSLTDIATEFRDAVGAVTGTSLAYHLANALVKIVKIAEGLPSSVVQADRDTAAGYITSALRTIVNTSSDGFANTTIGSLNTDKTTLDGYKGLSFSQSTFTKDNAVTALSETVFNYYDYNKTDSDTMRTNVSSILSVFSSSSQTVYIRAGHYVTDGNTTIGAIHTTINTINNNDFLASSSKLKTLDDMHINMQAIENIARCSRAYHTISVMKEVCDVRPMIDVGTNTYIASVFDPPSTDQYDKPIKDFDFVMENPEELSLYNLSNLLYTPMTTFSDLYSVKSNQHLFVSWTDDRNLFPIGSNQWKSDNYSNALLHIPLLKNDDSTSLSISTKIKINNTELSLSSDTVILNVSNLDTISGNSELMDYLNELKESSGMVSENMSNTQRFQFSAPIEYKNNAAATVGVHTPLSNITAESLQFPYYKCYTIPDTDTRYPKDLKLTFDGENIVFNSNSEMFWYRENLHT